jgi:hypothetical protein
MLTRRKKTFSNKCDLRAKLILFLRALNKYLWHVTCAGLGVVFKSSRFKPTVIAQVSELGQTRMYFLVLISAM